MVTSGNFRYFCCKTCFYLTKNHKYYENYLTSLSLDIKIRQAPWWAICIYHLSWNNICCSQTQRLITRSIYVGFMVHISTFHHKPLFVYNKYYCQHLSDCQWITKFFLHSNKSDWTVFNQNTGRNGTLNL